ncbi:MAG: 5'-methylthioadenosine/S-adenosylhomocysteine nucleosidase [Alphaproteobacteria bacterium]|nr:5'-methylthioadenosine/S-adenosylhomocysteine nucleosidase [Alphaproteobacteria bacterium]
MNKNILIVMALEDESRGRFDTENILFTGLGKVNAAYKTATAIHKHKPDLVINLGSAGSTHFKTNELVNCTKFVQRDIDLTAFGYERWETPYEDTPRILEYGDRIEELPEGMCGTGDSFDTSGVEELYNVVDMEAYALAKVCWTEKVPFSCIKFISDGGDEEAANDWDNALEHGSKLLYDAYVKYFKS